MPTKKLLVGQWCGVLLVKTDHHIRNACLGGWNAAVIRGESKVTAEGRLKAVTVEHFPFNLGSLVRFLAHDFDGKLIPVAFLNMGDAACKEAGLPQKRALHRFQAGGFVAENRPFRQLPVPEHELK
jgi:hypothetical protein